jgi:hypothetical protein
VNRETDEVTYVLQNLRLARQEAVQHPDRFEPDALEQIDNAIYSLQDPQLNAKAA